MNFEGSIGDQTPQEKVHFGSAKGHHLVHLARQKGRMGFGTVWCLRLGVGHFAPKVHRKNLCQKNCTHPSFRRCVIACEPSSLMKALRQGWGEVAKTCSTLKRDRSTGQSDE